MSVERFPMFEFLAAQSDSDTKSAGEEVWTWVKRHPALAFGTLLVATLIFAPVQTQVHHPGNNGPDEPPLFI